ncbi:hypothetical protein XPA_000893 [Xanthoria parietina]
METLARVDPSAMVYLAGSSERKVSVADAIYIMGDGDKASWAIDHHRAQDATRGRQLQANRQGLAGPAVKSTVAPTLISSGYRR